LKTDLGTQLPAVLANPAQVRQIVMNLIVNASESLGEKEGVISVTTSVESRGEEQVRGGDVQLPSGEYVRLQVSDTGCGISDPARARMFDPFFTTKFAGRGLGLAVVQGIVRARGGAIDVASTPGQGTTFTILLPSASESSGQPASAAIPALGGQHAPTIGTVLFVEDEESLRFAVSKMLRKTGFSVIEAADGRRAFELLESDLKIDVLFLDMTVPGTPSSAVIDKAMRTRPEITILLTSAYHQETVMKGIQSPQIRAFLRKPFRLDELVPLLKNGLASKPVDARLAWTQTES
jgi:CheY-like chemotaxis protein